MVKVYARRDAAGELLVTGYGGELYEMMEALTWMDYLAELAAHVTGLQRP